MERRSPLLAVAALAALAGFPPDAASDSGPLQNARHARWALTTDRDALAATIREPPARPSPASAEISWLKPTETKPDAAVQLDIDQGWALYADWDRYRTKLPQVRDTVDTILVGLQLRFR